MADKDGNDLMMMFIPKKAPIEADCQTQLYDLLDTGPKDPLLDGFEEGKFFEITNFTFGANLDSSEPGHGAAKTGLNARAGNAQNNITTASKSGAGAGAASAPQGPFIRWKSEPVGTGVGEPGEIKYPFKVDEVKFDRSIDRASTTLFTYAARVESFAKVSLVKRKVTGKLGLRAFMRMDFEEVLLTKIQFKNDDPVAEECSFIFRKLMLLYSIQNSDGSLADPIQVPWQYEVDLVNQGDR